MNKEKWYMVTGRESRETTRKTTKVRFGSGKVCSNREWMYWPSEHIRTKQRRSTHKVSGSTLIAYTLGETV